MFRRGQLGHVSHVLEGTSVTDSHCVDDIMDPQCAGRVNRFAFHMTASGWGELMTTGLGHRVGSQTAPCDS